jgi:Ca2+-transporting ATPase
MVSLDKPWSYTWEEIIQKLNVSASDGLSKKEADHRLKEYGPNRLRESEKKSIWVILSNQFKSIIFALLAFAMLLSFIFKDYLEGIAIGVVILLNAAIGFFTELKAVRSMEALKQLGSVTTKVLRDGEIIEISAERLVPGDIVLLEGGDIVTADLRLFEASKLQADESMLSGESFPVSKTTNVIDEDASITQRKNMLFKGTAITRGSCKGVVVKTGMDTELGKISSLVEKAEEEITPLEKRLNKLGNKLIWATLIIAFIIAIVGIISGKKIFLMIETSIALAVAAIPEGLPIVATIALARGMWRMARRNALVNRLSTVETLGATSVIFTDKTGTLTLNKMTVIKVNLESDEIDIRKSHFKNDKFYAKGKPVEPSNHRVLLEALKIGVLCNNASLKKESKEEVTYVGDPLETSLLEVGAKANIYREELVSQLPEVREEAFDSESKMMATYHKSNDEYYVAVKGAPESVLEACNKIYTKDGEIEIGEEGKRKFLKINEEMGAKGLRVLAVARKKVNSKDTKPYEDLNFVGLIGMLDPPRDDVPEAIETCKKAGIRVIMATGDQPYTARNIGLEIGLIDEHNKKIMHGESLKNFEEMSDKEWSDYLDFSIFARVSPKQKLDLISIHQSNNSIVAMTGDGVNDAPALKKADIGVAMGKRGTQVAREASDMILKDDAFRTIVVAINQGRVIFKNIRKFVIYLLSCNVSEVMSVAFASTLNIPLPILPLQILFLNLVTDIFPAMALGLGEGGPEIMKNPPRDPEEEILKSKHWRRIGGYGFIITIAVLGSLWIALNYFGMDKTESVTISFLTLAFAQLWHVFNMREKNSRLFHNNIIRNPYVWGALILCSVILLLAVYIPGISNVLKIVNPGFRGWILIIGMSFIPLFIGQIIKAISSRF